MVRKEVDALSGMPRGRVAAAIIREFPGRLDLHDGPWSPPPKPTAEETPWRSRWYVNSRDSADGNDYIRYAPIPEVEAIRQGLLDEDGVPLDVSDVAADPDLVIAKRVSVPSTGDVNQTGWVLRQGDCGHCLGTGRRVPKRPKGHVEGCACPACSPCKVCGGTGRL